MTSPIPQQLFLFVMCCMLLGGDGLLFPLSHSRIQWKCRHSNWHASGCATKPPTLSTANLVPLQRSSWSLSSHDQDDAHSSVPTANTNNTVTVATKETPKVSNIDLFAAGARRVPFASSSSVGASTSSTTASSSSLKQTSTEIPRPTSFLGKGGLEEAEILRLEAERAQLGIDQTRIAQQKELLVKVDQLVLDILDDKVTVEQAVTMYRPLIRKELYFRFAELANAASSDNATKKRLLGLLQSLVDTCERLDVSLHAELMSEVDKELKQEVNRLKAASQRSKEITGNALDSADEAMIARQFEKQLEMNMTTAPTFSFTELFVNGSNANGGSDISGDGSGGMQQMGTVLRLSPAVPVSLLPIIFRGSTIPPVDIELLRNAVFVAKGKDQSSSDASSVVFDSVTFEDSPYLLTIRGKISSSFTPGEAFNAINKRIGEIEGLKERVRVLMLPDSRSPLSSSEETEQEGGNGYKSNSNGNNGYYVDKYSSNKFEVVFVVLSRTASPQYQGAQEAFVSVAGLLLSAFTAFLYGTTVYSFNADFVQRALAGDDTVIDGVLAVAGGLFGLQACHELGHFIAAKFHKATIAPPILVPSLQIGFFGAITRFLDFPKSRRELFDVSIAGPLFGFIASIACLIYGLSQTASADPTAIQTFPALPTSFFQTSLLLNQVSSWFLPDIAQQATNAAVTAIQQQQQQPDALASTAAAIATTAVHPAVAIGAAGLLSNALNCLPIGRLDGGRTAMAVGGRDAANAVGLLFLIAQGIFLFSNAAPLMLFFSLYAVILQRGPDLPPEDDITPVGGENQNQVVNGVRMAAVVFCALLAASALTPVPFDTATEIVSNGGADQIMKAFQFSREV